MTSGPSEIENTSHQANILYDNLGILRSLLSTKKLNRIQLCVFLVL